MAEETDLFNETVIRRTTTRTPVYSAGGNILGIRVRYEFSKETPYSSEHSTSWTFEPAQPPRHP